MTRNEMYEVIKSKRLASEIKNLFDRHFTNLSNDMLSGYLNNELHHTDNIVPEDVLPATPVMTDTRVDKLIETLTKKRILLQSEIDYINN